MPGDIPTPATRVPNCGVAICSGVVGNGDNRVQTATANQPGGASVVSVNEAFEAFTQLAAAGFLGGITPNAAGGGIGASHPATPLGGTWNFGYSDGAAILTGQTGAAGLLPLPGHYVVTASAVGAVASNATPGANTLIFSPAQAASIDRKIDDGVPNAGSVMAAGTGAAAITSCANGTAIADTYREANTANNCGLYVKVQ